VTVVGEVSGVRWGSTLIVPSGDIAGLVDTVPWLACLRARDVMEPGGTKALQLEDVSALRGSSTPGRTTVRSKHGGYFAFAVLSEDIGPRRLLTSLSSRSLRVSLKNNLPFPEILAI